MNMLDLVYETKRREMEWHITAMKNRARMLISDLQRFVDELEREGINANINTLGVLQGNGVELDRLCGEFDVRRKELQTIEFLRSQEQQVRV